MMKWQPEFQSDQPAPKSYAAFSPYYWCFTCKVIKIGHWSFFFHYKSMGVNEPRGVANLGPKGMLAGFM